jgi:hypothetical protein
MATRILKIISVLTLGLALSLAGRSAHAQGVGNIGSLPMAIQLSTPSGWQIGTPASPVPVVRDPLGPKWLKSLSDVGGTPVSAVPGQIFTFHESLVIAGALSWSDWHEDILTPGWEWTTNVSFQANSLPAPGLTVTHAPGTLTQGGSISFDFNALPPGTAIDISKELVYLGTPGVVFTGRIDIEQYPTPEPASLGLFALGALSLRRRALVKTDH